MTPGTPAAGVPVRASLLLAALCLGSMMISIDFGLGSMALPTIRDYFGISAATAQWVLTADALAFGGFLLVSGRMTDVVGARFCFLFGVLLEAGGSLASALSPNVGLLIFARFIQGLGGALIYPSAFSLLLGTFAEGPARFRALMAYSMSGMLALPIGALLCSWLIEHLGWQAGFGPNILIASLAAGLAWKAAPREPRRGTLALGQLPRALLVAVGLAVFIWSVLSLIAPSGGWVGVGGLLFGMVLLGTFAMTDYHAKEPLVARRILRNERLLTWVAATALMASGMGGLLTMSNISLQAAGFTPFQAGLALIPFGVTTLIGGLTAIRCGERFSNAPLQLFLVCAAVIGGSHMVVSLFAQTPYLLHVLVVALSVSALVATVGLGAATGEAIAAAAPEDRGVATALMNSTMQIANAVSFACMIGIGGAISYSVSFQIGACLCLLAALIVIMPRIVRPDGKPSLQK